MIVHRCHLALSLLVPLPSFLCEGRILAQSSTCVPPPEGLVAWWRGENTLSDVAGTNNGTSAGVVGFALGADGEAFDFDGTPNSYITVPDSPSLQLTGELTMEFWVKRLRLPDSGADYVIEKGGDWTGGQTDYAAALHNSSHNYCLHFVFAGGWRGGGSIADTNLWHHCAIVAHNGDTDPTLYIDGVAQPVIYSEGAPYINLYPSNRPLHIGALLDPVQGFFYYGNTLVDELSLYNRALSASEIQAIYVAGSAGKCTATAPCVPPPAGLAAWWRAEGTLDDAAGTNNGVSTGAVAFAAGEDGEAFGFDGTANSYITVPDAPSLELTDEVTVEFWVKRLRLPDSGADYVIEKGGDWTGGQTDYAAALHNSSHNYCLHFVFAGGWRGGGSIGDTNSWHHCAIVARNGDTDPTLYIDGVAQPITYSEGAPNINLYPSNRPLHIGALLDPVRGFFYYGNTLVDELSLYSRALSTSEIQTVYNAGSGGKCVAAISAIQRITFLPDGNIHFTLAGSLGRNYSVLFSTDAALPLQNWSVLSSGMIAVSPFTLDDLSATNYAQKFYVLSVR